MIELLIRQALEGRLDPWAESKDLCVQHENETFEPPAGKLYLRATVLFAPAVENDAVAEVAHAGIFQIDVMGVAGVGAEETGKVIAGLRKLFPLDLILPAGQYQLMQRSPLRVGPAITDTDRYMVPTSLQFISYV